MHLLEMLLQTILGDDHPLPGGGPHDGGPPPTNPNIPPCN
jgi:hypothetical protein